MLIYTKLHLRILVKATNELEQRMRHHNCLSCIRPFVQHPETNKKSFKSINKTLRHSTDERLCFG